MNRGAMLINGLCLCLLSVGAFGATSDGENTASQTSILETPITRTQAVETQAALWRLEISEYERYLELMAGPLGKWNDNLDPLMALGMFPQNTQDERRYAELYAQLEFELTERVLNFQQAYRAAFDRLYPFVGMLDQRLLAPYFENELQQSQSQEAARQAQQIFLANDRLLIFVPLDCGRCLSSISHLMGLLAEVTESGVDVYIREAIDADAVEQWALENNIQAQWIEEGELTIYRDEGLYRRLVSQSAELNRIVLPIFLKRNDQYLQLDPRNLGL
ncbi:MAG: TIGR03759 family integrating conjugative element protein [SAR86 cluster bacterium]|uniref:TIGR03759 family integrating conjugative element protein n=1 Tax=SAR86 cluster bacterium TaxID=2030880 RepID=A0A2A5CHU4_9GAMM|nr:MAG: TIGR03759 family integrating conjugative element protein [SAR86 cluster bacterium]